MFQHKKLLVILVLAMVFSIASNWKYFFQKKQRKPVVVTAEGQVRGGRPQTGGSGSGEVSPTKVEVKPERAVDYRKMVALAQGRRWGADPFGIEQRLAAEKQGQEEMLPSEVDLGTLKLQSILITDRLRLATINHQLVGEGEYIAGARVVKIEPESVVLEKWGRRLVLKLQEVGVPLKYIREKLPPQGEQGG